MSASTKNYLALTPVSTIISGVPIDSQGEYPLREKISDPYTSLSVYSIPTYNNRAYIAEREAIVANAKDGTKKLSETDFDASQSVLVESSIIPPQTRGDAQKSAVVDYWKDEHIRITASTQLKQAILVISNSFYPGWQATIDGKKTDIYPVNIRFMGIVIPEGTHTVELRYFPSSFIKGLMMTTVGVIVTIGLFLIRKRIDALGEALPK